MLPAAVRLDNGQVYTAARVPNTIFPLKKVTLICGVKKCSTTLLSVVAQSASSLIGVQPEKKLVLLLSILFFLFTNGSWFSWDSSSITSTEAAVLGFFMNTSWSVISFRTYQESEEDNFRIGHHPEAKQLALEHGDSAYRSCLASVKNC